MEGILKFDDFINEEINLDRVSDTECYLTRPWYYYNPEDDIIYGSDTRPIGDFPVIFENTGDGDRLFTLDLDTMSLSVCDGDDVVAALENMGAAGPDDADTIQDIFDGDDDLRRMLIVGDRLVASSFDIIEEN